MGFAGSLVGLSDDLLGIVDISVDKLPLNTKLSGHSMAGLGDTKSTGICEAFEWAYSL